MIRSSEGIKSGHEDDDDNNNNNDGQLSKLHNEQQNELSVKVK